MIEGRRLLKRPEAQRTPESDTQTGSAFAAEVPGAGLSSGSKVEDQEEASAVRGSAGGHMDRGCAEERFKEASRGRCIARWRTSAGQRDALFSLRAWAIGFAARAWEREAVARFDHARLIAP